MGLIIALSVGLSIYFVWNRTIALQRIDVNVLAQTAERRLSTAGMQGLEHWTLDTRRTNPGIDVYVVDALGHALFERKMPIFLVERIHAMMEKGYMNGPAKPQAPGFDPFRSAPQITAPNGAVFTIFFPPVRDPSLAIIGTPPVQFLLLSTALIVSGAVCWWLARSVTKPVQRLQAGTRALAAGDLDARVGDEFTSRSDEFGVLARDFDQMAERLRAIIASKEELLRDISHELRTPLARLRLALGLARRDGADLNREHDRIEREAERLDDLIGNILQLTRLNVTEPVLRLEEFDYANLVSDVVEDARMEATAQNKQVSWQYLTPCMICGDEELLRHAIENVLRNAVRFTAVGTAVELMLVKQGNEVFLMIRDHGPGVAEKELTRLFEPFYRLVSQARERDTGGYGLGLAITARVVTAHHGRVETRNAAGGGLVVTLIVPKNATTGTMGRVPTQRGWLDSTHSA